jgi:hypothetical protein
VFPFGDVLHYTDRRGELSPNEIARQLREYLRAHGFADAEVRQIEPTIEDTFMARMGEPERAA